MPSPLATYLEHLGRNALAYQFSPSLNAAVFYPRVIAPGTGADDLEWRVSSGLGTVHSTTVVHPQKGDPFNVALIDVDEGFRMMSRVEDIAPTAVAIGMRVRFRVHNPGGDEDPYPVFTPFAAPPVPAVVTRATGRGRGVVGLTRGSAAIVGAAESDIGAVASAMTPIDLMAQGIHRALNDAGLTLKDVDGVFSATSQARTSVMSLVEYLGLPDAYTDSTIVGGSSFEIHVAHAQAALAAGLCGVAVIAYGSTQRTVGRRGSSPREYNAYETPYKPFLPATAYAMAARRHMHEFGTTREQLAEVAVAARQWALLNPAAWEKKPLTIADVIAARPISDPFTVRDICLVTDGGGAIVMVAADRAKAFGKKAVYVLGCGQSITHASISSMPNLTHTGAIYSGAQAYAMARMKPADIDVASLYDAFTINTILFLEDLGFCPKGEGGRFVSGGNIAPGGGLAVNTNGGGLSYCHPGMYGLFLLIEAVQQLRGERGAGQVKQANTAIVHGNGGVLSAQATVILGNAAAL